MGINMSTSLLPRLLVFVLDTTIHKLHTLSIYKYKLATNEHK